MRQDIAEQLAGFHQVFHDCFVRPEQQALALGGREGMWCGDSSEFPKKGKQSVGVARQCCGARGKTENCQSGAFVSFTSDAGYGLVEGRLYLPQLWFTPEYEKRRRECKIPAEVQFATKTQIALELLRREKERGILTAGWVGCDSFFGVDSGFRDELDPAPAPASAGGLSGPAQVG